MAQLSAVTESSSFSSIVLWFGRNNIFSRLSNECQAHEAQLYRGWFWEDFSVPANIFSLGLNGIQSICGNFTECPKLLMKISLWASDIWPPTQTITKFCTISCSSTSLLSLVELDLLLTSSSIWGMSPLPVPEWWEPGLVWLLGLGDLSWLNRTVVSWRCCCPTSARDSAREPLWQHPALHTCPGRGAVLQGGCWEVRSLCFHSVGYAAACHRGWMLPTGKLLRVTFSAVQALGRLRVS